jgi:2,4-dienoyl-CoA reductase-like NADH-dependent reductase (Old Yellow Enzyme family)
MKILFNPTSLKGHSVKNRIVFPPVVCFHYAGDDGMVNERNVTHYRQIARGGAGIIITEATAVLKEGRLAPFQLGIWSDDHIPGMRNISSVVKAEGAVSLLQIHHAGHLTHEKVSPLAPGPSVNPDNPRSVELTSGEIMQIRDAFILAAMRARKAGYDGVELHGAHGYLLNQFASLMWNKRMDDYGGSSEKNLKLATEIIRGIRDRCGDGFIIGYRLGANTPTLEDGIIAAKMLAEAGVDLLHVSHGGNLLNLPRPPIGFDYNWIVYSGTVIKSHVKIPVIAVNDIRTPERADYLLASHHVDFVAIGKPQLADPEWVKHVQLNEPINECFSCKPKCRWYEDSSLCPARRITNYE